MILFSDVLSFPPASSHIFNLLPALLPTYESNADLICHVGVPQLARFLGLVPPPGGSKSPGLTESAGSATWATRSFNHLWTRMKSHTGMHERVGSGSQSSFQRAWPTQSASMRELAFHGPNLGPKEMRDGMDLDRGVPLCFSLWWAYLR